MDGETVRDRVLLDYFERRWAPEAFGRDWREDPGAAAAIEAYGDWLRGDPPEEAG